MINYVVTDIFQSPAKVLVNTVNTVGVMGKGLAKDFKEIYPEMFKEYQYFCENNMLTIGKLWLYKTEFKWVLNFPTKKHWRNPSKAEYIEAGLKKFAATYADKGIKSISFPMLGCGNGELDFETQVKPLLEKYLNKLPIDIYVHLYRKDPFAPEHRNIKEIKKWLRSEPYSLGFSELWADLEEIVEKGEEFETISHRERFKIELTKEGIKIVNSSGDRFINKEHLLYLWQYVREVGFCMSEGMPYELEGLAPYVVSLLAELDYVKPVLISNDYSGIGKDKKPATNSKNIGIQLLPPAASEWEKGLFSNEVVDEVTLT